MSKLSSSTVVDLLAYAENSKPDKWWERDKEGWFFYKDKPKEAPKVEKQAPVMEEVRAVPAKPFTERMKDKEQELMSKAMENPTHENVKEYMLFNKARLEMSENFALMWQKVMMQYPELNAKDYYSTQDKDLVFERERKVKQTTLEKLSQTAALFFFYTSNCEFCKRQALLYQALRLVMWRL